MRSHWAQVWLTRLMRFLSHEPGPAERLREPSNWQGAVRRTEGAITQSAFASFAVTGAVTHKSQFFRWVCKFSTLLGVLAGGKQSCELLGTNSYLWHLKYGSLTLKHRVRDKDEGISRHLCSCDVGLAEEDTPRPTLPPPPCPPYACSTEAQHSSSVGRSVPNKTAANRKSSKSMQSTLTFSEKMSLSTRLTLFSTLISCCSVVGTIFLGTSLMQIALSTIFLTG